MREDRPRYSCGEQGDTGGIFEGPQRPAPMGFRVKLPVYSICFLNPSPPRPLWSDNALTEAILERQPCSFTSLFSLSQLSSNV